MLLFTSYVEDSWSVFMHFAPYSFTSACNLSLHLQKLMIWSVVLSYTLFISLPLPFYVCPVGVIPSWLEGLLTAVFNGTVCLHFLLFNNYRKKQRSSYKMLLEWWLLTIEQPTASRHHWRYQIKMMLQLGGYVAMFLKLEIPGTF